MKDTHGAVAMGTARAQILVAKAILNSRLLGEMADSMIRTANKHTDSRISMFISSPSQRKENSMAGAKAKYHEELPMATGAIK